jgi:hypothetical protein
VPPIMHFHPGWLGPTQGFGHGGYYARDGRYGHVGHQQDKRALGQVVWNGKSNHPISQETSALGHWQEQEALKDGSSIGQSRGVRRRQG